MSGPQPPQCKFSGQLTTRTMPLRPSGIPHCPRESAIDFICDRDQWYRTANNCEAKMRWWKRSRHRDDDAAVRGQNGRPATGFGPPPDVSTITATAQDTTAPQQQHQKRRWIPVFGKKKAPAAHGAEKPKTVAYLQLFRYATTTDKVSSACDGRAGASSWLVEGRCMIPHHAAFLMSTLRPQSLACPPLPPAADSVRARLPGCSRQRMHLSNLCAADRSRLQYVRRESGRSGQQAGEVFPVLPASWHCCLCPHIS